MRHPRNIFVLAALVAVTLSAGSALAGESPKSKATPPTTAPAPVAPTQYWFGVAVENLPSSIAKQLKLNPDQGLMILSVLPSSPAKDANLLPEDILVEINGHPLTSQNDLYEAANPTAAKTPAAPAPSKLTYLRGGDRTTIDIIPAARPPSMISYPEENNKQKVLTYVAPNSGGGAQIGMGLRVDLAADPSSLTAKSIREIVSQGKTIILSQETDIQGNIKNTITVGTVTHTVDPNHIDALPVELRPLAQQLVNGSPAMVHASAAAPAPLPATTATSLEQRLNALEAKNKELESQNVEFQKRIKELEKDKSK